MRALPKIKLKRGGFYSIRIAKKDHYLGMDKKDHYLGMDKKQAEEKARLLLADALSRPTREQPNPVLYLSVEQIALLYCEEEAQFYCSQEQHRLSVITRELAEQFTELPCNEFSSIELEEYQLAMANRGLARFYYPSQD